MDFLRKKYPHKKGDTDSVDLIYLDPPVFSNQHYEVIWGDAGNGNGRFTQTTGSRSSSSCLRLSGGIGTVSFFMKS
jgi:hypothetical protein